MGTMVSPFLVHESFKKTFVEFLRKILNKLENFMTPLLYLAYQTYQNISVLLMTM